MRKKGLKPTPLEFIRLTHVDPEYQERFVYCKKVGDFYDFEISPFEIEEGEEHMTVSARGIVHYINGEYNFVGVAEWEREVRIYQKIKQIPFFDKYRTWKTFSTWKTLMRRTMIFKTSDFLNRELFLLDGKLSKPLLDIREKAWMVKEQKMVQMATQQTRDLKTF